MAIGDRANCSLSMGFISFSFLNYDLAILTALNRALGVELVKEDAFLFGNVSNRHYYLLNYGILH